ncbi:hypothetical protein AB5J52_31775 [Streptomyces sp. R39]|uniref:Uncharacterized protein n=1 Tax=Streptomyces sp. R39 TaxID=3238631 RepID=A0AB39QVI1_9ACTN
MAAYLYDRLVTEDEYRQRIRRHRPSSLLPLIAAAAARYGAPERPQPWLQSPSMKYTPWALADAARVCLAYGTEYQRSDATERDLLEILAAYSSLKEPTLHSTRTPAAPLHGPGLGHRGVRLPAARLRRRRTTALVMRPLQRRSARPRDL